MTRQIILIAYTNRAARDTIRNANAGDITQQFRVITEDADFSRCLGLDPQVTRFVDLGGSEVSAGALEVIERRYNRAASLEAAIKWLRMPVTA